MRSVSKYMAELIGTFVMVLAGTGAMTMHDTTQGEVTHLMVALSFGISVWAMIFVFGRKSGAHINPAVSIAFSITGIFSRKDLTPYIIAQIVGALLASTLLYFIFTNHPTIGSTLPAHSWQSAFVWEFFLTFVLMLVILIVSQSKKFSKLTALSVGFTVFLEAYFVGPLTGASMNPARSIAPALLSGNTQFLWVYITSTIAGALVAAIVWLQFKK